MAPTICSDKEYRSRNRVRNQSSNNNNSSDSNSAINYVGKIAHRRSRGARNSRSIKFSIVNSYENDITIYNDNDSIIVDNNYQHQNSTRHSDNSLSKRNVNYDKIDENYNINIIDDNISSASSSSSSSSSSSVICDRLTPNQYLNRNLTEINNKNNNNNIYTYQKQSKLIYRNNSIILDDRLSSSSQTTRLNCTPSEITSTVYIDELSDDDDIKINKIFKHKQQFMKLNDKNHNLTTNSKGLIDIALKTITLIRRNQLLQKKLLQLQVETKQFLQSVMSNPENRDFCNKQLIN